MQLRQTILEASVSELELHSEAGFRVTRVAENAGCVVSVLYHHFENREGLIDAALIEIMRRESLELRNMYAAVEANLVHVDDLGDALERYVRFAHSFERAPRRALRVQILTAVQTRPRVQSAWEEFSATNQATAEHLIATVKERGLISSSFSTEVLAFFLRITDLGRTLEESVAKPAVDFELWVQFMRRFAEEFLSKN